MKQFWEDIHKKYDLNLGEEKFSPILSSSIGITLRYIQGIKSETLNSPLCLCFPEKYESAVWLAVSVLRNYYLEDYVLQNENRIEELQLQRNDYVEIYDSIARYVAHNGKHIELGFSDTPCYKTSVKISSQINRTNANHLSNLDRFRKNRRKLTNNRNAISRIIEPKEKVLINSNAFDSAVVLVTGRGNLSVAKKTLARRELYGESLADIFGLDTNLIVIPDLELYKNQFDANFKNRNNVFKQLFLGSYNTILESNKPFPNFDALRELKNLVETNAFNSSAFKESYDQFLDDLDKNEFPIVFNVYERYPGVCEPIQKRLQAVILNEISLFDDYVETIAEFLHHKIPVVIVCDKLVSTPRDISFYGHFFKKFPDIIRVNWSKQKIEALQAFDSDLGFLDQNVWAKSKKYADQRVNIINSDSHPLDSLLPRLQNLIAGLEGHENIKQAFWNYFHPASYSIKNDPSPSANEIKTLVHSFAESIKDSRPYLTKDANAFVSFCVLTLQNNITNTKKIGDRKNVISQTIAIIDNRPLEIPTDYKGSRINVITEDLDEVTFTGFPFNEPVDQVLTSAICEHFVPKISILVWPEEGKLTYQYINRRLRGGYFVDHQAEQFGIPSNLLLETEDSISSEMIRALRYDSTTQQSLAKQEKVEQILFDLSRAKFSRYERASRNESSFAVKCNIIHLMNGHFLFLPYTSKVLAQTETHKGQLRIKRALFQELQIGYKIFTYKLDKLTKWELLKSMLPSETILDDLYIWKARLEQIATFSNIEDLERKLSFAKAKFQLAGNPSRYNIYRWIYDDDLLSPDEDNLKVILAAAGDLNQESELKKIRDAYKKVNSLNIHISAEIKKYITAELNKLNDNDVRSFSMDLGNIEIQVQPMRISALQKDEIEIDYNNTRRILV